MCCDYKQAYWLLLKQSNSTSACCTCVVWWIKSYATCVVLFSFSVAFGKLQARNIFLDETTYLSDNGCPCPPVLVSFLLLVGAVFGFSMCVTPHQPLHCCCCQGPWSPILYIQRAGAYLCVHSHCECAIDLKQSALL